MTIRYNTAVKNARHAVTRDALFAGVNVPYLCIYSGTAPTSFGAVSYQELLCQMAMSSGEVADGYLNLTIPSATVAISGRAGWARLLSDDGSVVADMSVGITGSGADLTMATLDLVAGATMTPTVARLGES